MAKDPVRVLYLAPSDRRRTPLVDYANHYLNAFSGADGVEVVPFPHARIPENPEAYEGSVGWVRRASARIAQAVKLGPDDILHVELGPTSLREFWVAHFLSKSQPDLPVCLMLHDPPRFDFLQRTPDLKQRKGFLERLIRQVSNHIALYGRKQLAVGLLQRSDLILTHSNYGAQRVAARYPGFAAQFAHVAPLAMGPRVPAPQPDSQEPPSNSRFVQILFLFCPHAAVRFDDLIGSLIHLRRAGHLQNARILLRGELSPRLYGGSSVEDITRRLQALDLNGRIDFRLGIPRQESLQETLEQSDILVLPYAEESCNGAALPFLRAQTSSVALVASAIGAFKEMVDEDFDGLLYPPGHADVLAAKIAELIRDAAKRKTLAAALRDRAGRERSPERIAAQMEEIYREIIAARRQNRPLRLPAGARIENPNPE